MCWLDDEFLVSGSRDTKLALWRIDNDLAEAPDKVDVPTHRLHYLKYKYQIYFVNILQCFFFSLG